MSGLTSTEEYLIGDLDWVEMCEWRIIYPDKVEPCSEAARFITWHKETAPCGRKIEMRISVIGAPCLQRVKERGWICKGCRERHTFDEGVMRVEPL